ncbi:MAG: hypothetical protein JXR48_11095 [Candidatus Delongbacteria bacterium]|nr:hypothetical protein [Candidatus Delongbacteria bacterium]MBN2835499.1 hypothetical protein [Candidatus Delongbacteria bacterium]
MGKRFEYDQVVYDQIVRDFKEMSKLTIDQLEILEEIITHPENKLSDEKMNLFLSNEERLDELEVIVSNEIVDTLVLHQPAATDLRMVISIQRIVLNLERIGDLVVNIVNFIDQMEEKTLPSKYAEPISVMLSICINMVKKALKSFEDLDKDYAIWAIKNDEVVDDLFRTSLKKIINRSQIQDDVKELFFEFVNVNNIISNVERIGDKATNIAEASIYYMKGIDLRHSDIDVDKID